MLGMIKLTISCPKRTHLPQVPKHQPQGFNTMSTVLEFPQPSKMDMFVPIRKKNEEYRTREHLTPQEMDMVLDAAKKSGRNRHRDYTLLLVAYRHGLRVSELTELQWSQIDFKNAVIFVKRKKNGTPSTQPILGDELRALRKLQREADGTFLFMSERGAPISSKTVNHIVKRAGEKAGMEFGLHIHMLRHSTGYYLAAKGVDTRTIQAYLGHKNIQHTVRYTELSPDRFKGLWD